MVSISTNDSCIGSSTILDTTPGVGEVVVVGGGVTIWLNGGGFGSLLLI
jgi:hypothetical protein